MRKSMLVIGIFILFLSAQINAQGTDQEENPLPLTLEIIRTSFDYETRELSLDTAIHNETDEFLDNLEFKMELHKGDSLADEGMIFLPLEYTVTGEGEVPKLAPGEAIEFTAKYTPPPKLESGNYFVRLIIGDEERKGHGIDYSRNPVFLTGQGGFLPSP